MFNKVEEGTKCLSPASILIDLLILMEIYVISCVQDNLESIRTLTYFPHSFPHDRIINDPNCIH